VDSRNFQVVNSDISTAGPNQTVQFRFNTGTSYVHFMNSYLKFTVTASAGTDHDLKSGSALNFIRETVVLSHSGVEMDRLNYCNLYNSKVLDYKYSADYLDNALSIMDYKTSASEDAISTTSKTYCIPLHLLCGFFDQDKLCPSHLCAGLNLQITFETALRAIVAGTGSPSYTMSNMEVHLDSYMLSTVVRRKLDAISASNGLEYFYVSKHAGRYTTSATTGNFQVSRAVSRALGAVCVHQLDSEVDGVNEDSMRSDKIVDGAATGVATVQWRLGGRYFPNKIINTRPDLYMFNQWAFNKHRSMFSPGNVGISDLDSDGAQAGRKGLLAVNLETSTTVALSGLPLNNARRLNLDVTYGDAVARTVYIWLEYLRVAKAMLDNIKVSE
jgi:hypothetical protein